jgi:hypothetical protein
MGSINDFPLGLILIVLRLISRKNSGFLLHQGSLIWVGNNLLLHEELLELLYFCLG